METTNSNHNKKQMVNNISHTLIGNQLRNQRKRGENYENILKMLEETKQEIHSIITRHRVNHVLNKARQFETNSY
jgi:ABC-type Zn uptake system ZnuABC Zn-binding protein ZnuA